MLMNKAAACPSVASNGLRIVDPLKIALHPVASVRAAERNARKHSDRQIEQIAASIDQFGFLVPILIDDAGVIIAGHARLAAAKLLGLSEVPVVVVDHLSTAEKRAYRLADNKLALNSEWDIEQLSIELTEMMTLDLSFDIELTGFSTTELDLLADVPAAGSAKLDVIPKVDRREVSGVERGDVWQLGKHRLLCGDSREAQSFALLMGDERARMVVSDPPFNVPIDGHVGGLGKTRHEEFAMASGEMTPEQFTDFLEQPFRHAAAYSIEGALHYQCMDWRHMREMLDAGHRVYSGLQNLCVWVKDNGGMGSLYRSQHELWFVWKVGTAPHLNNVQLGKNGRYRTNVWQYRGATKTGAASELAMHPTVKPATMLMDAIKDTSKAGEIVLDPFGGSGSTLVAAHKARRRARLIEYEPKYCAVTIRRWQELAKEKAILISTGETFAQAHQRRNAEMDALCEAALTGEIA